MSLLSTVRSFFDREAPLGPGGGLVVAFSGGPDSTALLWSLARLAEERPVRLLAVHMDHGMDPGSRARAAAAAGIARALSVPFLAERREVPARQLPGESAEAAGRRVRYELLEEVRRRTGARWIATAHHRDDQAETVLLRLLFGSGLPGLAGIRPLHGRVVRPLLALPRTELAAALAAVTAAGLRPVEDPTNRDLALPRNRVRHALLPALAAAAGDLDLSARLARLAGRARGAGEALDRRLLDLLLAPEAGPEGAAVRRGELARLPAALRPFALAALHRRAGAPYPAGRAAQAELVRQLERDRVGCDCGRGWRWEGRGDLLVLRRAEAAASRGFSYTLEVPGEVEVPELGFAVRVSRAPVAPWMFAGSPRRAGLLLPIGPGDSVTVRSRRPGDRITPLGAAGSRRLKEVLIDRRMPRPLRDRVPLLCVGEAIAWVPGVTIDERFRLRAGTATAWVAEVTERGQP